MRTSNLNFSELELRVIDTVRKEGKYVHPGSNKEQIDGRVVEVLLRGLATSGAEDGSCKPVDVEICGAGIKNGISLNNLRSESGSAACALVLKECDISGEISLLNVHLKYLSLKESRISYLRAKGLKSECDIELTGVRALATSGENRQCHIELMNSEINGDIIAERAEFYAPQKRPGFDPLTRRANYALNLRNSHIHGSLVFQPLCKAFGGIELSEAKIQGNVWASGCEIKSGEGNAFNGQNVQIQGSLVLRSLKQSEKVTQATFIQGRVNLPGAGIGHDLDMRGVHIEIEEDDEFCLLLNNSRVGHDARFCAMEGEVFQEEKLKKHIFTFDANGPLYLADAVIEGDLEFSGAKVNYGLIGETAVDIGGSHIGKSVLFRSLEERLFGKNIRHRFFADGVIHLKNAVIKEELDLSYSTVFPTVGKYSIDAAGLVTGKDVLLNDLLFKGKVDFSNSRVGGSFISKRSEFRPFVLYEGFYVNNCQVAGNVILASQIHSEIKFENCHIHGKFQMGQKGQNAVFIMGDRGKCKFSLKGAKVDKDFEINGIQIQEGESVRCVSEVSLGKEPLEVIDEAARYKALFEELDFYPNCRLLRIQYRLKEEAQKYGYATLLVHTEGKKTEVKIPDGSMRAIRDLNIQENLQLTEKNVSQYIRFYFEHLWGDNKTFHVKELLVREEKNEESVYYRVLASVLRWNRSFMTELIVSSGGVIKEAKNIRIDKVRSEFSYSKPFVIPETDKDPFGEQFQDAMVMDDKSLEYRFFMQWVAKIKNNASHRGNKQKPIEEPYLKEKIAPRLEFDLTRTSVRALIDGNGASWNEKVHLFMDGFEYAYLHQDEKIMLNQYYLKREKLTWREALQLWLGFKRLRLKLSVQYFFMHARNFIKEPYSKFLFSHLEKSSTKLDLPVEKGIKKIFQKLGSKYLKDEDYHLLKGYFAKPWQWRKQWLMLQYRYFYPTKFEYVAQPFRQLAKVYHAQGQPEDARRITSLRLTIERRVKVNLFWKPFHWLYWLFFDYGLSPARALGALLFWLFLGWYGVSHMNQKGILVADLVTTASAVSVESEGGALQGEHSSGNQKKPIYVMSVPLLPKGRVVKQASCGDLISPMIYALDVMIPLVDFRQEFRCHIRSREPAIDGGPSVVDAGDGEMKLQKDFQVEIWHEMKTAWTLFVSGGYNPAAWFAIKALYTVLGWIISSLAFLTFTGTLRRQAEGSYKSDEIA